MLYVPIRIVHIKRYLLDKFQIEIRKKKKKKKKKRKRNGKEQRVFITVTLLLYQRLC